MQIFIVILLLTSFAALVALYLRVKNLEGKTLDISVNDVVVYTSKLQDIISEGERVAERLDAAIREREGALEDLGDLIDARLNRLKELSEGESSEGEPDELVSEVKKLLKVGRTKQEIARLLNMSLTEIELLSTLIK